MSLETIASGFQEREQRHKAATKDQAVLPPTSRVIWSLVS